MTDLNSKDILKVVLDDLIEATALARGRRILNHRYYRAYEYSTFRITIRYSHFNVPNNVPTNPTFEVQVSRRMSDYGPRSSIFVEVNYGEFPLADAKYEEKIVKMVNDALGAYY